LKDLTSIVTVVIVIALADVIAIGEILIAEWGLIV